MKLVSVILPVYNAGKYIEESILSIINQTYRNLEIIVINDGSKDNSFSIIQRLADIDDRIVFISRENKGLTETLNEGINIAKGDYIARMDADDVSYPERIAAQVDFLNARPEYVIVGTHADTINNHGEITNTYTYPKIKDNEIRLGLLIHNQFIHPSVLIRAKQLKECKYNSKYKHVEDYELWSRLLVLGKGYNISHSYIQYRLLDTSVTRQNRIKMIIAGFFVRVLIFLRLFLTNNKITRT